jgi:hypothetical protein
VSQEPITVSRAGEQVTVDVAAQVGCPWTAASDVGWISVVQGANGSGSGRFRLAVAPNAGGTRIGTVRVATASLTIHQTGGTCTFAIRPTYYNAGRGPDDILVNVTAESGCEWTVTNAAGWVTVAAGRSGSGNGTVRLLVEANVGAPRTALITIAGHTFTLRQEGLCTYGIKPGYYDAGRGRDSVRVSVTAPSGCTWSATSPARWVTVVEGRDGAGDGTVRLQVDANTGTARTAELTIAGMPFTLRQNGCAVTIKPDYYNAGRGPDSIPIAVSADSGCPWTAASNVPWVTVSEGASGSGDGVVRLLVQANTGDRRSTTLTIGGRPFELHQKEGR